jgi:transcriptional regulator with XRE-family HTH domain
MTKRKTAKDLHAEWMKEPAYAKAYADLEPEFQFASAVIKARAAAGMTQADLARRMDTTQTAIARLESGSSLPSTRTLKRVAEATGMRMHFGFSVKGEASAGKATLRSRIRSELAAAAKRERKK